MLFNSFQYLLFFPATILLYYSLPHRFRWQMLLAASYYFYMCWKPEYIILIVASTLIDYWAGLQMGNTREKRKRKKYLWLSLIANLGLLFSFKYFNFFNESAREVFNHFNMFYNVPYFDVLLPVGISFYTFQTLSYTIDVYRGVKGPEKHLGIFALYVSFFPQLVAGPIERSIHLLPQFKKQHSFDYDNFVGGLRLILWGMFKKVVIADRLSIYVDKVYGGTPEAHSGLTLLIATYFFAIQIYCDFSGYSDIAIGSARVMGFDLMENFKKPYFAKSISEFWKRWHISLSTWFRDYVYISLGGNRVPKQRWYANLLIVFIVSGLWHGANWTFVFWGFLHGLYLIIAILTTPIRQKLTQKLLFDQYPGIHNVIKVLITFHLVCLGWVYFRADSISIANAIVAKIFTFSDWGDLYIGIQRHFVYSLFGIAILLLIENLQTDNNIITYIQERNIFFRWSFYAFCTIIILLIGVFDGGQFIYFQF